MDIVIHFLAGILLGGLVNALADNLPHGRFLALATLWRRRSKTAGRLAGSRRVFLQTAAVA